jgi:hypothetical protein
MTESNALKPAFEPGFKFYKSGQLPEDKQFMRNALSVADNGDGTTLIVGPELFDYTVSQHEFAKKIKEMNDQGLKVRMGTKKDWDRLEACAYLKRAWLKANPEKEYQRYWEADEEYTRIDKDEHDNAMVRYPGVKDEDGTSQRVSVSKDQPAFCRWFCDVENFDLLEV